MDPSIPQPPDVPAPPAAPPPDGERYDLPTMEAIPFDIVQLKIVVAEMKILIGNLEGRLADVTAHLARIGAGRSAA